MKIVSDFLNDSDCVPLSVIIFDIGKQVYDRCLESSGNWLAIYDCVDAYSVISYW